MIILGSPRFSFSTRNLMLVSSFPSSSIWLPLSLMPRSKCSDLIMLRSWILLIFSMIEECYINFLVQRDHNRTQLQKGNINTCSTLLEIYIFNLGSLFNFEVNVFSPLYFSSIGHPPFCSIITLLMKFFTNPQQIILLSKCLDVQLLLQHSLLIEPSFNLDPGFVFFLFTLRA